jgi:hypothetical protein
MSGLVFTLLIQTLHFCDTPFRTYRSFLSPVFDCRWRTPYDVRPERPSLSPHTSPVKGSATHESRYTRFHSLGHGGSQASYCFRAVSRLRTKIKRIRLRRNGSCFGSMEAKRLPKFSSLTDETWKQFILRREMISDASCRRCREYWTHEHVDACTVCAFCLFDPQPPSRYPLSHSCSYSRVCIMQRVTRSGVAYMLQSSEGLDLTSGNSESMLLFALDFFFCSRRCCFTGNVTFYKDGFWIPMWPVVSELFCLVYVCHSSH